VRTAAAVFLLVLAVAAFVVLAFHWTSWSNDHRWHGNDPDPFAGIMGATGFVAAVIATISSRSLRSPARELIFVGGGLLTMLALVFGLSIAISN